MKTAFIITSAINTKFGVYTAEQRLTQTLDTIKSVRRHVPDAKIFAVELAGLPLSEEQKQIILANVDQLVDLSSDQDVIDIFNSTDNWDIVKNTTEVMGFARALAQFDFTGIDRVFKISGRYTLSDTFNIDGFELLDGRIVVSKRRNSQFGPGVTGGISYQYMSRLWSWPANKTQDIIEMYEQGFVYMAQTLAAGGYCDIEHMLFKFLPAQLVTEVDRIGIQGNIAPNGAPVVD
ncbi:MAG TPA: hypothetical protein VFM18_16940 [Methanosarcina sp.]|nr:hypothetical protein [Methanosarcina sp.]